MRFALSAGLLVFLDTEPRSDLQFTLLDSPICNENSAGDAMKFFFSVLGMVMILEGLPYFAFPERIKRWLVKVSEMPAIHLRTFGFAAMCVGMVLVYLGQKSNFF